ncbi:hypothetical protein HanHA300_Chr09g0322061 [Helianthus annuus]|nr:hypothetical protein HanHA300_Chr09g0322061 [Helianthus annuus]KAJ0542732.1 hypothetical protein HanHA89_Chr09g0342991 [Helianthus annuus]KAJ0707794.1 hypothetical protein HanLR1_Chr09g0322341 [Helianthus annuus]
MNNLILNRYQNHLGFSSLSPNILSNLQGSRNMQLIKWGFLKVHRHRKKEDIKRYILKARRTWSMTSSGMKTRREGAQKMKMIELPLAIINTTRISLHKDKVFSRA